MFSRIFEWKYANRTLPLIYSRKSLFLVFAIILALQTSITVEDPNLLSFNRAWATPLVESILDDSQPTYIELDNKTNTVYVLNQFDNTVSAINGSTKEVIDTMWVGSLSGGIGVDPITNTVYVENAQEGSVYVINRTENRIEDFIKIEKNSGNQANILVDSANDAQNSLASLTDSTTTDNNTSTISSNNDDIIASSTLSTQQENNTRPNATDDYVSTKAGIQLVGIDVLANDTDPNGDPLTIIQLTDPSNGTALINSTSTGINYTANPGFVGIDTFNYTISDGNGANDTASVSVEVLNRISLSFNQTKYFEDDIAFINATDFDQNPSIIDTITVLVNSTSNTSGVNASLVETGVSTSFFEGNTTLVPTGSGKPGLNVTDGDNLMVSYMGASDNATIVKHTLIARNDSASTQPGVSLLDLAVLENDTASEGATMTIVSLTSPNNGTAAINATSTGINYTADLGFVGADSFNYTVSDEKGKNDTATVTVEVFENNALPQAQDDFASAQSGITLADIPVLENDTDADLDKLLITNITSPANGIASINSTSTGINYTSASNFTGTDTINYTVSDGKGGFDNATLTVEVTGADTNTDPNATDDFVSTSEGIPLNNIDVLANDTDADDDTMTISGLVSPSNGTAVINSTSTGINYTSDPGFTGIDSFRYMVSDRKGGNDTATVTVQVLEKNVAPRAQDDYFSTESNMKLADMAVLSNDTDDNNDNILITEITVPQNGTAIINATSSGINYTANSGFVGIDSINYTVSDGKGGFDNATVTIQVFPSRGGDDGDSEDDSFIVEIKPDNGQDEPKPINPRSRGVVPVAIISTGSFDATTIIPSSIEFGDGEAGIAHRFPHVEDVNGDGLDDLMVHFWTQQIEVDDDSAKLCLKAETEDGFDMKGCDSIRIVPAAKVQHVSSSPHKPGPPPHVGHESEEEEDDDGLEDNEEQEGNRSGNSRSKKVSSDNEKDEESEHDRNGNKGKSTKGKGGPQNSGNRSKNDHDG